MFIGSCDLTLTCAGKCVPDGDFLDGEMTECGALVWNLTRCYLVSR